MKLICIIQARMGSTRLPGKVMLPILGRPMLELMIERLKRVRRIDGIVVATTLNPADDVIEELTRVLGVGCFRGSEEDVLDRVLHCATAFKAEIIVFTTGDCPLIDPNVIDRVIETFQSCPVDYCSNTIKRTYPRGMDTRVFPLAVLQEVSRLTDDPIDHEHVTVYIYEHPERFSLQNVESGLPGKYWNLRLTVDTPEDYSLIKAIYEELYNKNSAFNLKDILSLLERKPELVEINRHIQQKKVR